MFLHGQFNLVRYANSEWAGDTKMRKNTSKYAFLLGSRVISWFSKEQVIALSTAKAEYIAVAAKACRAIWLHRMPSELMHEQKGPTKCVITSRRLH